MKIVSNELIVLEREGDVCVCERERIKTGSKLLQQTCEN